MPASDAATDRDWRRLRSRIRLQGSARSARPGRFAAVWRAAAAVAVVCATFFGARLYDRLLLERATERYTVTTKSGDRSTVCLPDGTQVRAQRVVDADLSRPISTPRTAPSSFRGPPTSTFRPMKSTVSR